ncbi:hypothetical protein F4703DRAFT_1854066, partial [Phycomyces blakesleeanus]
IVIYLSIYLLFIIVFLDLIFNFLWALTLWCFFDHLIIINFLIFLICSVSSIETCDRMTTSLTCVRFLAFNINKKKIQNKQVRL